MTCLSLRGRAVLNNPTVNQKYYVQRQRRGKVHVQIVNEYMLLFLFIIYVRMDE